jgi:hypothetical protein
MDFSIADYVVQYKLKNWSWLGKSITQCVLWHNPRSPYIRGVTTRIFFNYLLFNNQIIMSDYQQTIDGHNFWLKRMNDAVNMNYKVGIANVITRTVFWYNKNQFNDIEDWIDKYDQFGAGKNNQAIRYVISN